MTINKNIAEVVRGMALKMAEGHLHRRLFSQMLRRIWALPVPNG